MDMNLLLEKKLFYDCEEYDSVTLVDFNRFNFNIHSNFEANCDQNELIQHNFSCSLNSFDALS